MNIWAPVIAALGASALTLFGSYLLGEHQNLLRERTARAEQRSAAYRVLLARSFDLIMRVQVTDAIMSLNSSLGKDSEMSFRGKAIDLFDFFDWLDRAFQPLNDAWSHIWAVGSQDAINAADLLFKESTDLMRKAISSEPNAGWLQSAIKGAPWTDEQRAVLADAVRRVAKARVTFAAIMREETVREPVEFAFERTERRRASEPL